MGKVTKAWWKRTPTSPIKSTKTTKGRSESGAQSGGGSSCTARAGRVSGIRSHTTTAKSSVVAASPAKSSHQPCFAIAPPAALPKAKPMLAAQ